MQICALSSGPHAEAALHALFGSFVQERNTFKRVICITNSSQDISLSGLRFCPDLDAAVRALSASDADLEPSRRPTHTVMESLAHQGLAPGTWEILDDEAVAAAVARGFRAARGMSATECATAQAESATADIMPLTDEPIELHVIEEDTGGETASRHVQRWLHDENRLPPARFAVVGADRAHATASSLAALRNSDVVILLPMSPVLDAAGLLAVTGVRDALRGTTARVVVLSPAGLATHRDGEVAADSLVETEGAGGSVALARLYADFADVIVIDDAEPIATYPKATGVTRAPLAAALAGDDGACEALRSVVLGN